MRVFEDRYRLLFKKTQNLLYSRGAVEFVRLRNARFGPTQEAPIPRILVVDDQDVVRRGVRQILETQDAWEVVGEALNGQEAIRLNQQLRPDAIVMDIAMPVMNGLDATDEIVKANPDSKVLIVTMYQGSGVCRAAQASGARGLISKSGAATELTPALKIIIAGGTYFRLDS
jgi:DNA-binding NarL/FixJ family response regulator